MILRQNSNRSQPRASILQYARYVRVLHAFGKPQPPSDLSSLIGPIYATGSRVLLPQLRHLRWVQFVPSGRELIQLISPSLRSLHIIFRTSPDWRVVAPHMLPSGYEVFVRDLLRDVVMRTPNLRYLRISTSGDVKESWLEPLEGFHDLETVDLLERIYCDVTTFPLIRSLSTMTTLRHLKFRLPSDLPSNIPPDAFATLDTLTLDAMFAPLHAVAPFLAFISSPHLHTLAVQNCACTTLAAGAKMHAVCEVIRARFSPSLRTIELALRGVAPVVSDSESHPLVQSIEPLLEMHDLRDVRIAIAPEVRVVRPSEGDLEKMAEAWPRATCLHLGYAAAADEGTAPSLEEVAELVGRCKGLVELVLPGIDASASVASPPSASLSNAKAKQDPDVRSLVPVSVPAPRLQGDMHEPQEGQGRGQISKHGLRTLSLSDSGCNSRIPDPARLAAFLDRLFPEVEWRCPPLASEMWRETIMEVLQLRIGRMHVRRL